MSETGSSSCLGAAKAILATWAKGIEKQTGLKAFVYFDCATARQNFDNPESPGGTVPCLFAFTLALSVSIRHRILPDSELMFSS